MGLYTNIKRLCDEKKISISMLEKALGFGNGTIRRWDNTLPSSDKLEKVADYFNTSMDKLMDRKVSEFDTYKAYNETEKKLLLLARKAVDVPVEHREAAIKMFENTIDYYLKVKGIKGDE